jgi:hypothetical protein
MAFIIGFLIVILIGSVIITYSKPAIKSDLSVSECKALGGRLVMEKQYTSGKPKGLGWTRQVAVCVSNDNLITGK